MVVLPCGAGPFLAVALALSAVPAMAGELRPVCGRPEVLRQVAETLRRAGGPVFVEPKSVGEMPTLRPDIVRCGVRVHRRIYDTDRLAYWPIEEVGTYQFTLELRRNGIFVHPALY